ncbi:MAG: GNAT family N-acetyltransferase, partial [Clostridiales bacterium]|nr:GNAT family N-acetyltransferase [Clostridiales bacterium]
PLNGAYSIDYFIGEEIYIGKGLGKAIIGLLTDKIFSLKDAQRIIVQPDEENNASCNSLLSNGYVLDGENNVYIKLKEDL